MLVQLSMRRRLNDSCGLVSTSQRKDKMQLRTISQAVVGNGLVIGPIITVSIIIPSIPKSYTYICFPV